MGIFGKKNGETDNSVKAEKDVKSEIKINERPRIFCIDLKNTEVEYLKSFGYNIYSGSLGKKINIPNSNRHDSNRVLLNFDFPPNLHEYDIIIINLDNYQTCDFKKEDHIIANHTGKSALTLLSSYPETLFDPRPLSSLILKGKLKQIGKRPHMIITFTTSEYEVEYESLKITEGYAESQGIEKYNIYSYTDSCPTSEPKYGKEISICNIREDFKNLLESFSKGAVYNQTFHHPTIYEMVTGLLIRNIFH